jgi:hypothetical protein
MVFRLLRPVKPQPEIQRPKKISIQGPNLRPCGAEVGMDYQTHHTAHFLILVRNDFERLSRDTRHLSTYRESLVKITIPELDRLIQLAFEHPERFAPAQADQE